MRFSAIILNKHLFMITDKATFFKKNKTKIYILNKNLQANGGYS